jgi:ribose transport system ATP-binding protein
MMDETVLEVAGVSKAYAGNPVLVDAHIALKAGRVHALVGENGAGKSTLVKIISGGIAFDGGSMRFNGAEYRPHSPVEAQSAGIVTVQQELSLSPYLPAYQNLWLGHEGPRGRIFIRTGELRRRTADLCSRYGVRLAVNRWVSELSLEEQQVLEILKALALEPRVVIFDEATSALGAANTRWLLDLIRRIKAEGCAVLFISHRMSEVVEIADDITVLKDGRKVGTVERDKVTEADIVRMMVGRDLEDVFPKKLDPLVLGSLPSLLVIDGLYAEGVRGMSFSIRKGEVLGLAGLEGQGQHELLLAMFGLRPVLGGTIAYPSGRPLAHSPTDSIRNGIGFVPVDRRTEGVVLPLSVGENIALATLDRRCHWGWVDAQREQELVRDAIDDLGIRTSGPGAPVESLSGGNQQKVALGKWLVARPSVLLLDDPTRGVDIETRRDIYYRIRELSSRGVGILLNSTDTIELVGLCDRVLVVYEGEIVHELVGREITEEGIVGAAVGLGGAKNGTRHR